MAEGDKDWEIDKAITAEIKRENESLLVQLQAHAVTMAAETLQRIRAIEDLRDYRWQNRSRLGN